jgi:asparagine synthase (glutamine-hydrolysing)
MCGIVGILLAPHSDPNRLAAVEAMASTLHHRGPDGAGVWIDRDAGVALGHRRLAIVDLSDAGRQPMLSHGEGVVMIFNGEVYNFADLRMQLQAIGHCFRGRSDSEVILAAFESFGIEAALRQFAGMFALGVWDRRTRVLHLIRDRMGKKPLYVAHAGTALLFASELKAILAYPGFRRAVDPLALAMMLRHGWVPDHHCIWQDVFKLPPGTMLSIRRDDLSAFGPKHLQERVCSWWSLADAARDGQQHPFDCGPSELEAELDRLLRLVVRQRMVADVPLGAFLSGGIDSSAIVGVMQAQSTRAVKTFTIGFCEAEYDEAHHAAKVARHFGTEHTEFRVTPAEALAVIPDLPRVWDEPFADESQIPTLLLTRLARQHVTVALSGDGGDECFGGYARHFTATRLAPLFGLPSMPRRMAASAIRMLGRGTWEAIFRALPLPAGLHKMLRGDHLHKLARVLVATSERDLYERLITFCLEPATLDPGRSDVENSPPLSDMVGRLMYRDMARYLPSDILVKLDRASLAASLEARSPFLDHRMVEFAWRLPTSVKVHRGQGKWLLRKVLRRYLPEPLFERPKQGFDVPIGAWLAGPLREWADELLNTSRIQRDGLLDAGRVTACWRGYLSGQREHAGELWAILMVQAWLELAFQADGQRSCNSAFEAA